MDSDDETEEIEAKPIVKKSGFAAFQMDDSDEDLSDLGKCFTCVTKTIANLATYSRKLENYNGTIIFEFDIMKNSSPINSNLYQT